MGALKLEREDIEAALRLPQFDGRGAQTRMQPIPRANQRPPERPGQPRKGAVLILLYPRSGQTHLVLTRRRDDLDSHAGQISLPGGRQELDETLEQTALRETMEEVGVRPARVDLLGELTPLYIPPSDYEVHPFVGWHETTPSFVPEVAEVAEIIEVPLSLLLDDGTRQNELWTHRGYELHVPFFQVNSHKVWGATAMMLSDFVGRLLADAE